MKIAGQVTKEFALAACKVDGWCLSPAEE